MSSKVDMSLDEIIKRNRKTTVKKEAGGNKRKNTIKTVAARRGKIGVVKKGGAKTQVVRAQTSPAINRATKSLVSKLVKKALTKRIGAVAAASSPARRPVKVIRRVQRIPQTKTIVRTIRAQQQVVQPRIQYVEAPAPKQRIQYVQEVVSPAPRVIRKIQQVRPQQRQAPQQVIIERVVVPQQKRRAPITERLVQQRVQPVQRIQRVRQRQPQQQIVEVVRKNDRFASAVGIGGGRRRGGAPRQQQVQRQQVVTQVVKNDRFRSALGIRSPKGRRVVEERPVVVRRVVQQRGRGFY